MKVDKKYIAREVIRLRIQQMVVNEWYKTGKFKIPIHLGFGHEALAVAVRSVMASGDQLFLTHRNIAYHLARAPSLTPFLDEYALKKTGLAGGRFGSMNLINPSLGIPYTSSILANQFPVAVGSAFSRLVLKKENIAIVCGGDGAIEEGAFYESVLLAASIKAPVLFLIENNGWSMHTSIRERRAGIDLKKLADSLTMEYVHLQGNNVFSYLKALFSARKKILKTHIPMCVEVHIKTLGDWYDMKNPLFPDGKFVKYHTGAAPSISLSSFPFLESTVGDPLFVLSKIFGRPSVEKLIAQELRLVQKYII